MFARFDENPAMTLRVIKETKRYGRTDARTDARTDVKTVYPLQTKFAGGIIMTLLSEGLECPRKLFLSYMFIIFCILGFSVSTGFIQASMSKIQGLFKDF